MEENFKESSEKKAEVETTLLNVQSNTTEVSVNPNQKLEPEYKNLESNASSIPLSFGSVFRRTSGIAIPMGFSFTFSFAVFLATLLINNLSQTDAQAASATLVSILMNTVCVFFVSPLFAVAIKLSHRVGEYRKAQEEAEDEESLAQKKAIISSSNAHALLIAGVVSIPAFFALFFSKALYVSVFGQDPAVSEAAQNFLRVYSFAVPAFMARMGLEQIMFGFAKAKPAMWMALSSLCVGGLISLSLGFGVEVGSVHIPRLGASGVALGFAVESYLTAISYGLYVRFSPEGREFEFFKNMFQGIKKHKDYLQDILRTGRSISFTVGIELALTLAVGIFSGLVSVKAQSAMTFNMQFVYFQFIFLSAFSMVCAQEISRELGAKNYQNAYGMAKYGFLTTLIYMFTLPLLFAIDPKILEWVSGGASHEISTLLATLVPIMSAGVVLDAARYNLLQQLRGLGDLNVPNWIALTGLSGGIILAGMLGLKTNMGINGVAIGYAAGVGATATALGIRWFNQIKPAKMETIANN